MSENIKKGDDSTYPRRNRIIDVTANKSADTAAGITPRRRAFVIMRRKRITAMGEQTAPPYSFGKSKNCMPTLDLGKVVGDTGPQGPQGATGPQGAQGIQGPQGVKGQDGKSAYESAQDGGYTGTEVQFNSDLADVGDKIASSEKGTANGVASLGANGKVPDGRGNGYYDENTGGRP